MFQVGGELKCGVTKVERLFKQEFRDRIKDRRMVQGTGKDLKAELKKFRR